MKKLRLFQGNPEMQNILLFGLYYIFSQKNNVGSFVEQLSTMHRNFNNSRDEFETLKRNLMDFNNNSMNDF